MMKRTTLLIGIVITVVFLFLRLYHLDQSLYFFNDIGRDFLVLLNWQQSGKPPLLGPQTSALPFNQSAIYFYLFYPLFILTNHSQYSTILTNVLFYVVSFWLGLWWLRKQPIQQSSLLIVSFLIAIHPQFIIQQRFIWNPSFLAPCLLAGFYALLRVKSHFSRRETVVAAVSLAVATALSYSVVPVVVGALAVSVFWLKKKVLWLWGGFVVALCLVNLPTIFFELRHQFLLTNMLLHQEKLAQPGNQLSQKILDLWRFSLQVAVNDQVKIGLVLLVGLILCVQIVLLYRQRLAQPRRQLNQYFVATSSLFVVGLVLTLLAPIAVQAHYIFGVVTLFFLMVSFLDRRLLFIVLLVFTGLYLRPIIVSAYFAPAPRSYVESHQCAQTVCQQLTDPFFVSVQAQRHPYHNGMEFQYLFKEAGCDVRTLDPDPTVANMMAVVVDDSEYQHNRTAYNELTQFGSSTEVRRIACTPRLEVVVLEKN